ncbi:MAG: hypothetical protein KTR14_09295 [Vampirovibrio sp.]|nr:hypothetical protein [Vampirovibrio sp.]
MTFEKMTDKFMTEVRQLISLMRKEVKCHRITMGLPAESISYQADFHPTIGSLALQTTPPTLHQSPLGPQAMAGSAVQYDLLKIAALSNNMTPKLEPVVCREPALSETKANTALHTVTFEGICSTDSKSIPVESIRCKLPETTVTQTLKEKQPFPIPTSRKLTAPDFKTNHRHLKATTIKSQHKAAPGKLLILPLAKSPIPINQFTGKAQIAFRKALAEKAKTSIANVEIRAIFDRMMISLFQAMSQDERGRMLCTPRAEFTGKHSKSPKDGPGTQPSYLIMGVQKDNNEAIRALIPASKLEESSENSTGRTLS